MLRLSLRSTMLYMLSLPLTINTKASHANHSQNSPSNFLESYRRPSNPNYQPDTNHLDYMNYCWEVSQTPNAELLNPSVDVLLFFLLKGLVLILVLRALTLVHSEGSPPL